MYETGCAIAFLLWAWSVVNGLIQVNSQLERNLNRVGQRLSWLNFAPKLMQGNDFRPSIPRSVGKFLLIYGVGLLLVVTSWLYVTMAIGGMLYARSKDAGAPQDVKEMRWRMKNIDMPMDEIIRLMMKASGQSEDEFDQVKADFLRDIQDRSRL